MVRIIILLGILVYLKYCNFFIQNMNRIAMAAGKEFYLEPQKLLILSVFPFIHLRQSAIWLMYTGAGSKRA